MGWVGGLRLARQSRDGVSATHVIALLGNQQQDILPTIYQPDPISLQSLENLIQLEAMMNYN